MTARDIPEGVDLVIAANWNQTEADWAMMLAAGEAFCVRNAEGRAIATSLVLPYDGGFGWVSMVLVHPLFRRQGIATRLLEHAIAWLQARSMTPVLDATPAGREVYERLGFSPGTQIRRWRGYGKALSARRQPLVIGVLLDAVRMDAVTFGAARTMLLNAMASQPGAVLLRAEVGAGYLFARRGRTATQLGPVLAKKSSVAVEMVKRALTTIDGPLLLDVPDGRSEIEDLLVASGFALERTFTRMSLDWEQTPDLSPKMHVIAGPELG